MLTLTVEVDRLKVYAFLGVMEQERVVGNEFEVTVKLSFIPFNAEADSRPHIEATLNGSREARDTLTLEETINYADLVELVKREMQKKEQLLENVAIRLKATFEKRWPFIRSGAIRIAKLTPPIPNSQMTAASVSIDW